VIDFDVSPSYSAAVLMQYPFATMTRRASKAACAKRNPASDTVASDENRPFIFDKSDWRHYSERKEHAVVRSRRERNAANALVLFDVSTFGD
jgi:hypothetical protein